MASMSNDTRLQTRPIDHLVLPTASLAVARQRLGLLGFTVAPDAVHPFGTGNACVYLRDGTYLEPLAVVEREVCEAEARHGNVFVARDAAYRFRRGTDGFSAVGMGSSDAEADHRSFIDAGISAGDVLSFSRPFTSPDGQSATASFLLAFAADLRAPDAFFFTCQRINAPAVDRSALQKHPNSVVALREVVLTEPNPADFQYLLQDVVRQRTVEADSFGLRIASANGGISVLTPAGFSAAFGGELPCHSRGLRLRAVVFAATDLAALSQILVRNHVPHDLHGRRLVVPAAAGQGAIFAFEEA